MVTSFWDEEFSIGASIVRFPTPRFSVILGICTMDSHHDCSAIIVGLTSVWKTHSRWPLRIISRIISIKQQNTFKSEGLTQRYRSFVHCILNIGGHENPPQLTTDVCTLLAHEQHIQWFWLTLPRRCQEKAFPLASATCTLWSEVIETNLTCQVTAHWWPQNWRFAEGLELRHHRPGYQIVSCQDSRVAE